MHFYGPVGICLRCIATPRQLRKVWRRSPVALVQVESCHALVRCASCPYHNAGAIHSQHNAVGDKA
eukprot:scaffold103034_cov67-Phaeocystis_antarctica.AAC.3